MKLKAKPFFIVIMTTMALFFLAACTGLTPGPTGEEKAVPVYQGMVVSETLSNLSTNDSISSDIMRLSNIGVTRNLNTNPIDQDDPFGTLDVGTISDVITTEFPVVQTEVSDYYSEINKDIFITVKLSNPDNFVILSFTLNGVFYQSYQFQDGSDSENLKLKVNTGTVSGIKEYTIDAIKYIDGTETKDATFAGERTITVGLKHNSEPSVLVSNEVVNATSILLTVNLSDPSSLSTLNKIVLYDGASLVQIYELSLGENNIVFDKLNINTLYQYAVISVYDLIDGNNSRLSLLEKKALFTDDIVAIDNIVPTQTSIGFGITVTDADQVGAVSAIELYQGETLIEALTDLSVREFTGLLSNNAYTIQVTYTYDLNDGLGEQTVVTTYNTDSVAKAVPAVEINTVVPTHDSVSFNIDVTDEDLIGSITAIELYQGETLIEALTDLSVREFTGLLSNNAYTIQVTYTYDLNDGLGEQTVVTTYNTDSVAKATPVVVVDNVVPTQDSIGFGITVIDTDEVGAISAIELYQGETLIEALTDLSVREFTGLLSNNAYTIQVTYTYDLNDGIGEQTEVVTYAINSEAKTVPTVEINTVVPTQESVSFNIDVTDEDLVGSITAIDLYQGETLIESLSDLNLREFNGLLSNNEYQIKVTYTFDLNDGMDEKKLDIYIFVHTLIILGTGTENDPYLIYTSEDLDFMRNNTNSYYVLMGNIDLMNTNWTPIPNFSGSFNGQGYVIKNFAILSDDALIGFFGTISGTVSNLQLFNVTINLSDTTTLNSYNVGILAGRNIGDVYKIFVQGEIDVLTISRSQVGGLIGVNNGVISNSISTMNIKTSVYDINSSASDTGGLVGYNYNTVLNSYTTGTIYSEGGNVGAGGIIGYNQLAIVQNSISICDVGTLRMTPGSVIGSKWDGLVINVFGVSDMQVLTIDGEISTGNSNGDIVTAIEMDETWYIDTLGWSSENWDFSPLNNEDYPTIIFDNYS